MGDPSPRKKTEEEANAEVDHFIFTLEDPDAKVWDQIKERLLPVRPTWEQFTTKRKGPMWSELEEANASRRLAKARTVVMLPDEAVGRRAFSAFEREKEELGYLIGLRQATAVIKFIPPEERHGHLKQQEPLHLPSGWKAWTSLSRTNSLVRTESTGSMFGGGTGQSSSGLKSALSSSQLAPKGGKGKSSLSDASNKGKSTGVGFRDQPTQGSSLQHDEHVARREALKRTVTRASVGGPGTSGKLMVTPRTYEEVKTTAAPKTLDEAMYLLSHIVSSRNRFLWNVVYPTRQKTAKDIAIEKRNAIVAFLKATHRPNPEAALPLHYVRQLREGFRAMTLGDERLSTDVFWMHLARHQLSSTVMKKKQRPLTFAECMEKMFPGVPYDQSFGEPAPGSDAAFLMTHQGRKFLAKAEATFLQYCEPRPVASPVDVRASLSSGFNSGSLNTSMLEPGGVPSGGGGGGSGLGTSQLFPASIRDPESPVLSGRSQISYDADDSPYTPIERYQYKYMNKGLVVTLEGLNRMCDPTLFHPRDVERIMTEFDQGGDGVLDFAEFAALMLKAERIRGHLDALQEEEEDQHQSPLKEEKDGKVSPNSPRSPLSASSPTAGGSGPASPSSKKTSSTGGSTSKLPPIDRRR